MDGLAEVGLIGVTGENGAADGIAVTLHPVVADANRSWLLSAEPARLAATGQQAAQLRNRLTAWDG
jgi:hypothetical protein